MRDVKIGDVTIGRKQPLTVIAGPCVLEEVDEAIHIAESMRDRCADLGLQYIFKASFDKANRSAIDSPRGPGLDEGLKVFEKVRERVGVPITTDIHDPEQAAPAAEGVDLLQIPAFLSRQTDLLVAAAATGKPVNAKKGQFLSPAEMINVVNKLEQSGAADAGLILTERGTFFGYGRLVNDFVGIGDMMEFGWPICFDVTHSTQQPGQGSGGKMSGGRPEMAPLLARAAVAAGVDAVFIETHPEPGRALSDAATMLPMDQAMELLESLKRIRDAVV